MFNIMFACIDFAVVSTYKKKYLLFPLDIICVFVAAKIFLAREK